MFYSTKYNSKLLLISVLYIGLLPVFASSQITYYSKSTGAANNTATWGINPNGSGANPGNFESGDVFIITSGSLLTTDADWAIDDAGTPGGGQLIINGGGRLTADHLVSFIGTETLFQLDANSRYIHHINSNLGLITSIIRSPATISLDAASNFEISISSIHTSFGGASFGNMEVTGSGTVFSVRSNATLNVQTNIIINNTCSLWLRTTSSITGNPSGSGTGTLRVSSSSTSNLPTGKTWLLPVLVDSSVNQRVQGGTYSNLNTTGGNRTVTAAANIILTNSFTPGAGTYTIGTGATFEFSADGTGTIPALPYQNLSTSGTGTKSLSANTSILATLSVTNPTGFLSLNGFTLTLNNGTNLSNGRLIGSPSSSIVISGNTNSTSSLNFNTSGTDNQLHSLTLNRTGGGGASLASSIDLINKLVLTSGILATNNNTLTLKSSSIANSARVDAVGAGASITYGSIGGIRSERFIPAGFRSYRDISSSGVYTDRSFIFENWQESAGSAAGYGTHITGLAGSPGNDASTGLDKTQSGNIALFTYNGSTYPSVTNTKSTRIDPYRGYRILIRGDRNVDLTQTPTPTTMNTATTLRATGQLIYGTVNFSTAGVSNAIYNSSYSLNSASSTGFSLIGNPYACPISWGKILDNGAGNTENIQSTYWYFDPQQGVNGVYATWLRTGGGGSETGTSNGIGNTNNFIQPGQAIFVRNNSSTSPKVQINESNKAINSSAVGVFSNPTPNEPMNKLALLLHRFIPGRGWITMDGSVLLFSNNNQNLVITNEDAGKITNGGENMGLVNRSSGNPQLLSIESRKPITELDTIPIQLWKVVNNENYTLKLLPKSFSAFDKFSFVKDKFLHKEIFIRNDLDTIALPFTTLTNDSASFYHRFSIIAKQPFSIFQKNESVQLAGTLIGNKVDLKWTVKNESDHLLYDIEKSTNGIEYSFLARSFFNGSNTYSHTDSTPSAGNNFYRIRTYNQAAGFWNSNTATIEKNNEIDFISIYPNPVTGNTVNIRLNKLAPGNYTAQILDQFGRLHFNSNLVHTGQSLTTPLVFNRLLANGIYQLQLIHIASQKKYSTKMVITKN